MKEKISVVAFGIDFTKLIVSTEEHSKDKRERALIIAAELGFSGSHPCRIKAIEHVESLLKLHATWGKRGRRFKRAHARLLERFDVTEAQVAQPLAAFLAQALADVQTRFPNE